MVERGRRNGAVDSTAFRCDDTLWIKKNSVYYRVCLM